jgi:hypothetical protein
MSLTLAGEMAVSMNIVKPVLGKKIGRSGAVIIVMVPLVSGLISGTIF